VRVGATGFLAADNFRIDDVRAWGSPHLATQIDSCDAVWALVGEPTGFSHVATAGQREGAYLLVGTFAAYSVIPKGAILMAKALVGLDMTGASGVELWWGIPAGYTWSADWQIEMVFYSSVTLTEGNVIGRVDLPDPQLGWSTMEKIRVSLPDAEADSSWGDVAAIALVVKTTFAPGIYAPKFLMDDISPLFEFGNWPSPASDWEYAYAYAGPESFTKKEPKWILSSFSRLAYGNNIQSYDRMRVSEVVPDGLDDYGITNVLIGRRPSGAASFTYVDMVDISGLSAGDTWTYDDYGVNAGTTHTGFDEDLNLPEYIPIAGREPASPMAFMIEADGVIYGAKPDDKPLDIAYCDYRLPWYWPADNLLRVPKQIGTTIVALANWQSFKVVLLDREFFLLRGDPTTEFFWQRCDEIGCISRHSEASWSSFLVWSDGVEFFRYTGTTAPIGLTRVDASLVDWTAAHKACCWKRHYCLYCTYDGEPSLLMYSFISDGWAVHRVPAMFGICTDGTNLYGVNAGGYPVQLFKAGVTTDFLNDGTTTDVFYEIETAKLTAGIPNVEHRGEKIIADMSAGAAAEVTLGATSYGITQGGNFGDVAVGVDKDRSRLGINAIGASWAVQFDHEGAACPTVHSLGVRVNDGVERDD
jgi:hypothetical protein